MKILSKLYMFIIFAILYAPIVVLIVFSFNEAGSLAEYSVHLGSGVVHQIGGSMIPVLPVHSQHRGKVFLPFVDDDPKTAEIISKVLLFAEDHKIMDPTILSQISK